MCDTSRTPSDCTYRFGSNFDPLSKLRGTGRFDIRNEFITQRPDPQFESCT